MSNALLEGIKKWLNHIKAPNGYSIRLYLQSHNSHYTDASKLGFGGHSPLYSPLLVDCIMQWCRRSRKYWIIVGWVTSLNIELQSTG